LSAELTKTHSFRLLFFLPTGKFLGRKDNRVRKATTKHF